MRQALLDDLPLAWPFSAQGSRMTTLDLPTTRAERKALPTLLWHLVHQSGEVGGAVGLLYYVNTLGAGAACLVCCAVLFPFLGMRGAVLTAVGFNVAVAIGAIAAQAMGRDWARPVTPTT